MIKEVIIINKGGFSTNQLINTSYAKRKVADISLTKSRQYRKIWIKAAGRDWLMLILSITLILTFTTSAFAHSGRTDVNGGHNKTSDGTYHYHSGNDRNTEYPSPQNSAQNPVTIPASDPSPAPASAEGSSKIKVMVDKEIVKFDQEPIMLNDRVLVPIRYVAEKIGCSVDWDSDTQTVYINDSTADLAKTAVKSDSINVFVNNERIVFIDQPPINMSGRILIPVRFVTEKLNYAVDWDSNLQIVYIDKIAEVIPE